MEHAGEIERVVRAEEERFRETLERGLKEFEALAGSDVITREAAFTLAATYGFPIELTVELAEERGQAVDVDGYREEMARHRQISRAGGEKSELLRAAEFSASTGFRAEFVGYSKTEVLTQIGALEELGDGTFFAKLRESPFYPEGGGQVTDSGLIEHEETGANAELLEAFRFEDDQVLRFHGEGFAAGDRVKATVPWVVRHPTQANHTATHLLHKALQEVLGDHVRQAGSAVRPDKLRFDFTHPQSLTEESATRSSTASTRRSSRTCRSRTFVTPIEEARKLGAMMLFGEKYGEEVRVVEVPGYSRELCGGTHARSTAEIGAFAILSEGSVGSGVRRIEAVTSGEAYAFLHAATREAADLREELTRTRKEAKRKPSQAAAADVETEVKVVGGVNVIAQAVDGLDADALLDLSDRLKQQRSPAAVVLGSREDGKVHLVANFDSSVAEKIGAGDVVREIAPIVGGGGGGRPTMARAGGKDPERLPDAIARAAELLEGALAG